MADIEVQTASSKLNSFMEKNRKGVIAIAAAVIVVLVAFIVIISVSNSAKNKGIQAVDEITYELTNGSSKLEVEELKTRCETALEKIGPYTSKGGIVGARANMLAADVSYILEKYTESADYWNAVAAKGKNTYLEPIAKFNLGVCYEDLNNIDAAAEAYKAAAGNKDFVLKAHAKFSYGRVLEEQGKYAEAVAVYKDLNDILPNDTWAKLAKSRIISLENAGKAN